MVVWAQVDPKDLPTAKAFLDLPWPLDEDLKALPAHKDMGFHPAQIPEWQD